MSEKILAWHFVQNDRKLRFSKSQRLVRTGQVLHVNPEKLELCSFGLHASRRAMDALKYAPGPIICRVELSGKIIEDKDKLCAERRKVLWMADATETLHEFVCQAAEAALAQIPKEEIDPRSLAAIAAKRKWLKREINNDELNKAYDEAWKAYDEKYGGGRRAQPLVAARLCALVPLNTALPHAAAAAAIDGAHAAVVDCKYYFNIDLNDKLEEMLNQLHW